MWIIKMVELFNQLLHILENSIINIENGYFNFQVAGNDDPIERERVYGAELYSQIRARINEFPFSVNFEPDKIKHPYIEEICGAIVPDLVINNPGLMNNENNLAVIEIKRSSGNLTSGIIKDVQTINCMTTIENGYYGGIIIVFGQLTELRKNNLIDRIRANKLEETNKFILMLHHHVNICPEIIGYHPISLEEILERKSK